ncbi:heavy metal transport/detoxification protein [Flavihumibacter sp. CACIAM 22H1]|uniref:heavy-metal-associated domain-containing protein n=1 Tax=Flavihumibacter sp. CACIAM 22H1 TaxID=1812911 RepID=UPI0007A81F4E|nr:heavy metal transport/detoxification protein [Flavihumibacter sp. CACIAM 22H1]KYP13739.1 MAG: heavy metal transport/detoxification protein [Flavihumibacter sp. CACIAM 22H1]
MNQLEFKTTIKCSGCIEKVTPYLNKVAGQNNWEVDLQDPSKKLIIPQASNLAAESIIKALEEAGYKAEKL